MTSQNFALHMASTKTAQSVGLGTMSEAQRPEAGKVFDFSFKRTDNSSSSNTSKEWAHVVDANIGFHNVSHSSSNFTRTTLLEKEAERLRTEKAIFDKKLSAVENPNKFTAVRTSK